MFRVVVVALLAALSVVLTGCATGTEGDFDRRKVQAERDSLRQQVASEQAKSLALQKQLEAGQTDCSADRAKAARLSESLDKVTRDYEELRKVVTERASKPLERPAVGASPLPAELDEALQAWCAKYPERVAYERGRGAVSFGNDGLFHPGSDVVKLEAQQPLQTLAAVLTKPAAAAFDVVVVGHTDNSAITKEETLAKHPSNWHLSVHRAIAVQDVLIKAGVTPQRLGVMGYGEYRPLGPDRARNRRVEVFVVPRGAVQSLDPVAPGRTQ